MKRLALSVTVALLVGPWAIAQEAVGPPKVPQLDLSRIDPAVRHQLSEHRRQLDALIAQSPEPPELVDSLLQMGQLYLAYDYVQAGVASLEAAHPRRPKDAGILYLLGYAYDRDGRRQEAIEAFEKSLALEPSSAVTRLRLGNLLLVQRETESAAEQFEQAYAADATCVGALYGQGEIARRAKDDEAAAKLYTRALELAPDATPVRYSLGLTLRRLGRREEAETHLQQADWKRLNFGRWLGCADPRVAQLTDLTTGAPAHLLRAAQAGFKGRPEVELAEYRKAVASNPEDPVARANLGSVLYRRGDLLGATKHYRQAVQLSPDSASYRHDLGQILLEQGSTNEAAQLLESAVELNPRFKEAHLKLAELHLKAGRFQKAIENCRGVIAVDPLHRQARVQLAMALVRTGQQREGIAELGRLMDDHPPENPLERLHLATLLAQLGDADRAVEHYLAVGELDAPPNVRASAYARAGQVQMQRGQTQQAVESFRAALKIAPDQPEAKAALARLGG